MKFFKSVKAERYLPEITVFGMEKITTEPPPEFQRQTPEDYYLYGGKYGSG